MNATISLNANKATIPSDVMSFVPISRMRALLQLITLLVCSYAANTDFNLHLFSRKDAVCLDGSPGGFYFRKGSRSEAWIIHFEGGGYCWTMEECYERSKTSLGSSNSWNPARMDDEDGGSHGFLSTNPSVNPLFYEWNMIRIQYCDGLFYAADRMDHVTYYQTNLFFRGRQMVQSTFETLIDQFGLQNSAEVIITACSAGGIGVFLHLDWIRNLLPQNIRVVGAPDSGYFLDVPNYRGKSVPIQVYQEIFTLHNAKFADSDCSKDFPPDMQFRCASSQYSAKYVTTPMFVMSSLADAYQLKYILMLDCFKDWQLENCSPLELEAVSHFRATMIDNLQKDVLGGKGNGAYLLSCLTHCGACGDLFWDKTSVDNVSLKDAFQSWYFHVDSVPQILIDDPWPTNACKYGYLYDPFQKSLKSIS